MSVKGAPAGDPAGTRFAMELGGRKACRHAWEGLVDEMARAGWFDGWQDMKDGHFRSLRK
jgi:hypothetical protein